MMFYFFSCFFVANLLLKFFKQQISNKNSIDIIRISIWR